jgi:hypothetical protein
MLRWELVADNSSNNSEGQLNTLLEQWDIQLKVGLHRDLQGQVAMEGLRQSLVIMVLTANIKARHALSSIQMNLRKILRACLVVFQRLVLTYPQLLVSFSLKKVDVTRSSAISSINYPPVKYVSDF